MQWAHIRPLLANWPGGAQPPTFEIAADENGDAVVELAWDPVRLMAPASYLENLAYYSTDVLFDGRVTSADGKSLTVKVPAQTITLTANRAEWTMPQALWDGYVQESLKHVSKPSSTSFTGNLYYRVRVTPTGSSQARMWPPDTVVSGNVRAPHMGILPISAVLGSLTAPDMEAVEAMGGIPFAPTLWRDMLLQLWNGLPRTSSARKALADIFDHTSFNEIGDKSLRAKILKLWLLGGKAREKVPRLLSRRVQTGSNLDEPALAWIDLKGRNTLVDNLLALRTITPHPDIKGLTVAEQLIDDVVTEILAPYGQVNQGLAGTCTVTSMQAALISLNPAEYARLALGMLSRSGQVELANGDKVQVPPQIFDVTKYPGGTRRTNSELAFQATVLRYGRGSSWPAFDPKNTAPFWNAVLNVGLTAGQFERALEGLFKTEFTASTLGLQANPANPGGPGIPGSVAQATAIRDAFLRDLDNAKQPLFLATWWGAPIGNANIGAHAVLALRREGGRVFFKNPQYDGANPTSGITRGGDSTTAGGTVHHEPPRRFDDPAEALESISEADLANRWIYFYLVQKHAIG